MDTLQPIPAKEDEIQQAKSEAKGLSKVSNSSFQLTKNSKSHSQQPNSYFSKFTFAYAWRNISQLC